MSFTDDRLLERVYRRSRQIRLRRRAGWGASATALVTVVALVATSALAGDDDSYRVDTVEPGPAGQGEDGVPSLEGDQRQRQRGGRADTDARGRQDGGTGSAGESGSIGLPGTGSRTSDGPGADSPKGIGATGGRGATEAPGADNGRIAFTSRRENSNDPQVYVVNADGTGLRKLVGGINPGWSPDGRRLVVANPSLGRGLSIVDPDTGASEALTTDIAEDPEWSPDGREVVYIARRPGTGPLAFRAWPTAGTDIYVVDVGTRATRPVTADQSGDGNPTWSPDSSRIAFASHRSSTFHVLVRDRDGTSERALWSDAGGGGLDWSHDGQRLVIGGSPLRFVNHDGSGRRAVGGRDSDSFFPQWSPDSRFVIFETEVQEVVIIEPSGRVLVRRPGTSPTWSPTGSQVAYCDETGLWRMNRDGSGRVRITKIENCAEATWR